LTGTVPGFERISDAVAGNDGLSLTGKSIARLGELKGPRFAEYFLIGTLLSVSLALCAGVFLKLALYGSLVRR